MGGKSEGYNKPADLDNIVICHSPLKHAGRMLLLRQAFTTYHCRLFLREQGKHMNQKAASLTKSVGKVFHHKGKTFFQRHYRLPPQSLLHL